MIVDKELGGIQLFSDKAWQSDFIQGYQITGIPRFILIDPDGNISLPLAGVLAVAGLSPSAIANQLAQELSKHLVNPQISINIASLQNRKVFILGEVRTPGSFSLDPRMSLAEVIVRAGGFTNNANKRRVLLARQGAEAVEVSALDMNPKGEEFALGLALPLRNRDVIYVPESRISSVERFMLRLSHIVAPITGTASAIVLGDDAIRVLGGDDSSTGYAITK